MKTTTRCENYYKELNDQKIARSNNAGFDNFCIAKNTRFLKPGDKNSLTIQLGPPALPPRKGQLFLALSHSFSACSVSGLRSRSYTTGRKSLTPRRSSVSTSSKNP